MAVPDAYMDAPIPRRVASETWLPVRPPSVPRVRPEVHAAAKEMLKRHYAHVASLVRHPATLAAADAWNERHQWHRHVYFGSGYARLRATVPGVAWGAAAFCVYVALDSAGLLPDVRDPAWFFKTFQQERGA